jgi:antitoxin component of MazEF toxin-antitoxin module
MNYLKKIVQVGDSKAIVLPKTWLDALKLNGYSTTEVLIDVSDKIVITPVSCVQTDGDKK